MGVRSFPSGSPDAAAGRGGATPVPGRRLVAGPAWVCVIPALATLVVVLDQIQRPSFWRDEGATLSAVHRSMPELLRMLGTVDVVHSAYYLLMWVVVRVAGSSELAVRFPSAVAMAVTAGIVTALGRRLVSVPGGLAAGLVFAALPSVTSYGHDAREYAIVAMLAAIAGYLLVRATAAGTRRRRWLAAYGVALAGLGLGNLLALLLIPAHALTLALAVRCDPPGPSRRQLVHGWLVAVTAALVVVSPVAVIGWRQRAQIAWVKPLNVRLVTSLQQLLGPPAVVGVALVIAAAAAAISVMRGRPRPGVNRPSRLTALCLPWLLLPPAALLTASLVHPVFSPRYIAFCTPAAALLIGGAVAALGTAAARAAEGTVTRPGLAGWATGIAAVSLIVLAGLPALTGLRIYGSQGQDLRRLSAILSRTAHPGDAVYFLTRNSRAFLYAYPDGYRRLRDISLLRNAAASGTLFGTNARVPAIRRRLRTVSTLWVIEASRTLRTVPALAGQGFWSAHRQHIRGIWLLRYARLDPVA
jgi:mannosyltransferase